MAQTIGTFDFKKLNVIFGVAKLTGFADGDAVEITEEISGTVFVVPPEVIIP